MSALAVLSLLAIGAWAVLTLAVGILDLVHALRTSELLRPYHPGDIDRISAMESVDIALSALWFLSLGAVALGAVLGAIDIAAVRGQRWRAAAFAVVTVAGPVCAHGVSNTDWYFRFEHSLRDIAAWELARSLTLIALGLVTSAAAWWFLSAQRRPRSD